MKKTTMIAAIALLGLIRAMAADPPPSKQQQQDALAKMQAVIGEWRGVGQVRRGSSRGAWTTKAEWAWSFSSDQPALKFKAKTPKFYESAELRAVAPDKFQLIAKFAKQDVAYAGKLNAQQQLVLTRGSNSAELPAAAPDRITIRTVADGKRLLVLFERRSSSQSDRFSRMAEVGYTLVGSNFGQGSTYVECVVTGGKGTIPVTHEGKTYYVCCGGCRDYFNENPAEVLADYQARKQQEQAQRAKQ